MPRYTINIGNDFPLGDDHEPGPGHNSGRDDWGWVRRGMRSGMFLRIVFLLAAVAIVLSHPFKVLLLAGLLLLVRRSPWFIELRARLLEGFRRAWPDGAQRFEAWRAQRWDRWERGGRGMPRRDEDRSGGRRDDDLDDGPRGYRGFV
jgi:hypothetical protein